MLISSDTSSTVVSISCPTFFALLRVIMIASIVSKLRPYYDIQCLSVMCKLTVTKYQLKKLKMVISRYTIWFLLCVIRDTYNKTDPQNFSTRIIWKKKMELETTTEVRSIECDIAMRKPCVQPNPLMLFPDHSIYVRSEVKWIFSVQRVMGRAGQHYCSTHVQKRPTVQR